MTGESGAGRARDIPRKSIAAIAVVAVIVLILTLTLAGLRGQWVVWTYADESGPAEIVDVAVDGLNRIHILKAIEENGIGHVRYRMVDGGSTYDVGGDGLFGIDLKVDNLGSAHFVVVATTVDPDIYYAHYYSHGPVGIGEMKLVDYGVAPVPASIAVDDSGYVHITYSKNGGLNYTTNSGGEWTTIALLPENYGGGPIMQNMSSVVGVDSHGSVHVCYGFEHGLLGYVANSSGEWTDKVITYEAHAFDMVVDSADRPRICYAGTLDGGVGDGIIYMSDPNSSSSGEMAGLLDRLDIVSCSIAADGQDIPHIAYGFLDQQGEYQVGHMVKTDGEWTRTRIMATAQSISEPRLALAQDGSPYIGFSWADNARIATDSLTLAEQLQKMAPGIVSAAVVAVVGAVVIKRFV